MSHRTTGPHSAKGQTVASRKQSIIGWVLSGLLAVFLIGLSAPGKFTDFPGKAEMFQHLGWSYDVMKVIGVIEIAVTILFLIPRTSFVGAILVTAYLGGAIATHVRVNDPWFMPVIMGVVLWIALGLRQPGVFREALGGRSACGSNSVAG